MTTGKQLSLFFDTNITLGYIKEGMPSFHKVTESSIFNDVGYYINDLQKKHYDVKICFVDIVLQEINHQMNNAAKTIVLELEKNIGITKRILGDYIDIKFSTKIPKDIGSIVQVSIEEFIKKYNIDIIEYKKYLALEVLLEKAVGKTYPFINDRKHKRYSAWKDTVIYATAHAYQERNRRQVVFCTADADFDDLKNANDFKITKVDKNDLGAIESLKKQIDDSLNITDIVKVGWEVNDRKSELKNCLDDIINSHEITSVPNINDIKKSLLGNYYVVECDYNGENFTIGYDFSSKLFSADFDISEAENDNL